MTFTEAAVEVLRRAGKPLHYNEIAEFAVRENLLSHVGMDPEGTMGQRLAAMAKREEERRVVAIDPPGTFALVEWSVPAELVVEPVLPAPPVEEGKPYRPREREPRPISPSARRRIEANQGEEPAEQPDRDREAAREKDRKERERRGHRFGTPAEVVFDWLAQRGSGASLAEVAGELVKKGLLSEGLLRDLPSLAAALLEDNRRRTEAGRKPGFIVDRERVSLVEFPPPQAIAEAAHSPQSALGRPATAASLVAEMRRATVRALRARLAELEMSGFEMVCTALLEKMGMRDLRVAKRAKDGPLFLARQRRGVSDLRVAVRLIKGKREIGRADVQELRKDLSHYSAQMAVLLSPGEAGRESRSEAGAAAQPPVALYTGEALAEELVAERVGVSVQVVEIAEVDEVFFANAVRAQPGRPVDKRDGERPDSSESADSAGSTRPAAEGEPSSPARSEADGQQSGEQAVPSSAGAAHSGLDATGQTATTRERGAPEASSDPSRTASEPQSQASNAGRSTTGAADSPAAGASGGPAADGARRTAEDRGRRGRREERPKLLSPTDQAWGQPAGTPRKGLLAYEVGDGSSPTQPQAPLVASTTSQPEGATQPAPVDGPPPLEVAPPPAEAPPPPPLELVVAPPEPPAPPAADG
jgi:hypothetical protein